MDKEIFISHRSIDKAFVDLLETFLTTCGIPSESIFCSSLPGNDILCEISNEIKAALNSCKLNIVLLSDAYYQSAYCQNEAGIIWYSDTIKIVFVLPEINEYNMEGFLNNENKIRCMDNKNDMLAFSDILKSLFPSFIQTVAGLNAKIDKLIEQYQVVLGQRAKMAIPTHSSTDNRIEGEILNGSFSDSEKTILLYFYETQKYSIDANMLPYRNWLNKQNALADDNASGMELLTDSKITECIKDDMGNVIEYKLLISAYRDLRKITKVSVESLKSALHIQVDTKSSLSENEVDNLIKKGFSAEDILLLKYIMDLGHDNLYAGWQTSQETDMIRNWEEINGLDSLLSRKYEDVLKKMFIRKFIKVEAVTSNGNTKEYRISPIFLKSLQTLSPESKEILQRTMEEHQAVPDELPF